MSYKDQRLPIEKVFRDPIHNYIHVEHQVILDLINSKEFQRLRRIKQLGTSSFTFHGGEHSRFSHSLGVYEIARKICNVFKRNYSKSQENPDGWQEEERLVTLCAALLHDVGHGPYSHTFEHIFHTNHEAITVELITSPQTEIYQILHRVAEGFPEKVASVITKTYPNPQVVQMISSQIDADRMDYLLRDAYFTGTEYGTFDLTRILRVIKPYKNGIAYQYNGMHAVEDYIVSRYQMYMQVYFHPVSRGMEVILDHLLKRGRELFHQDPEYFFQFSPLLVPFFQENYSLEDYLKLDDGTLNTYFMMWLSYPDPILSDLSSRFLNRKPLKSIKLPEVSSPKEKELLQTKLIRMEELIKEVGFNPVYYTAQNSSYDLPYDLYHPHKPKQRTEIELIQNDRSLIELSQASDLVSALTGENYGDHRFYFPKELLHNDESENLFIEQLTEFRRNIRNGMLWLQNEEN